MPVVATAGHVDHGKSTLILALTGRDPDRWEEEKRRGLTIDLGFAWTELPSGLEVGFVDVPGHERFIKNMLAGIDAVDAVLFVVAADEGWMPQTEEHLAIVSLLGITRGVIALTRADLVDPETLELAELEVRERVEGSPLESAPVIPVAAPEGRGLRELTAALDAALAVRGPSSGNRPRLWVDRSFTISGAGTVVTGTLVGGSVAVGDSMMLWPGADAVRIRSLQSHERSAERVEPGTRAALNLAGVDRSNVPRGAMLGRPGQWRTTRRFAVRLRPVRFLTEPLRDRGAFHLHVGSGAWPVRLRLLDAPTLERPAGAIVTLEDDLPLRSGDRFVLRDVGRRSVVAGGTVLDPHPPRRAGQVRATVAAFPPDPDPDEVADILLRARRRASLAELEIDSGGGRPRNAVLVGDSALERAEMARLERSALEVLERFHTDYPLRPGMPKPDLAGRLSVSLELLEGIAARSDRLVEDGATIRAASFGGELDSRARKAWEQASRVLGAAGLSAPRRDDLGLDRELLHALVRRGHLIEVSDDYLYLPATLNGLVELVSSMPEGFTVSQFRDLAGITRRHAVPLLEWLDAAGITRREGDRRTLRRPPSDGPASGGAPSP